MIIKALMMLIKQVLGVLLIISLPSLPVAITSALGQATGYIMQGVAVLRVLIGSDAMSVLGTCLSLIIAIEAFMKLWQFVWWVLSKIPMLNLRG